MESLTIKFTHISSPADSEDVTELSVGIGMIVYKVWIEMYVSFVFGFRLSVSDDRFEFGIDSNESTEGAMIRLNAREVFEL